jgi:hypothetical protein
LEIFASGSFIQGKLGALSAFILKKYLHVTAVCNKSSMIHSCFFSEGSFRTVCILRNSDNEKNAMYSLLMSRLEEVKEILNTLRVAMSLSFGMLVIVVGGIIKRFDQDRVDVIFWLGLLTNQKR